MGVACIDGSDLYLWVWFACRYFDGTGGNNHAVDYYAETKYPLAVKLGTITADGAGKCHHYETM